MTLLHMTTTTRMTKSLPSESFGVVVLEVVGWSIHVFPLFGVIMRRGVVGRGWIVRARLVVLAVVANSQCRVRMRVCGSAEGCVSLVVQRAVREFQMTQELFVSSAQVFVGVFRLERRLTAQISA